ncbi:MAG: VCBS repeat-containing protein [Myxococcales bacterium]|nr:VCBS repeat-containing protein [Myxococcales bacterium]
MRRSFAQRTFALRSYAQRSFAAPALAIPNAPAIPTRALTISIALGSLALCACGDERAVVVRVESPALAAAEVCLTASAEGELLYNRAYSADEASGTLTFVAGARVADRLRVAARLRRGGRTLAIAAGEAAFGPGGSSVLPLRLGACAVTQAGGLTLGAAPSATRVVAVDLDGDGRDELVVNGDDLRTLAGEVLAPRADLVPLVAGDPSLDCLEELLVTGPSGVLSYPSGRRVSAAGDRVALADAGRGPEIATADADGLRWGPRDDVMRSLTGQPIRDVVAVDLNGDGADDLVAVGDEGIVVFFGGPAGPSAVVGATPTGWTGRVLVVLDVDGDGAPDLAIADETRIRVARNRGDGLLEGRGEVPVVARALYALDVDGDCLDDLVVVADDGARVWLGHTDGRLREGPTLGPVVDAAPADVDGDGVRELVLLRPDGEVVTWR